ncbi:MAG: thioredoxin domain-containing protein [Planctomycetes bacterium]|nr:thioredoxin domain-containing protein [Planctomycetota bacterium]
MTTASLVYRCPACGGINRVAAERAEDRPVCGRCRAALDLAGTPVDVDDDALERLIRGAPVPVLVDFHATWCGPCRMVAPVVADLARAHAGRLIVVKVDTDRHTRHAAQVGVRGVPTFAVFRGGALAAVESGALPRPRLEALLSR